MNISYTWHDLVGNIGVGLIVWTYFWLQIGRIDSRSILYSALNGLGAALVLISLYFEFNLSAFLIEIFWLVISLIGLFISIRDSRRSSLS